MNTSSADFDDIVFFAYQIGQDISSCMHENNWIESDCQTWETAGFKAVREFLLEDIDASQLAVRKQAVLGAAKQAMAQIKLYTIIYRPMADGDAKKKQLDLVVKAINIGCFLNDAKEREENLMEVLSQGLVLQSKRKPTF